MLVLYIPHTYTMIFVSRTAGNTREYELRRVKTVYDKRTMRTFAQSVSGFLVKLCVL